MFRIKICGITNVEDGQVAAAAGADAIGLNFFEQSSRYIEPDVGRQIARAVGDTVAKVGVFVDASADVVMETYKRVGLDWIQLHGNEPPEMLAELGERPVIKAFACGDEGLGPATEYLRRCRQLGRVPRAALIDASVAGQFGGTGKMVNWDRLVDWPQSLEGTPLILAGGLTAENVAGAIRAVHPRAVDTASGVEESAGKKDAAAVAAFVIAAAGEFSRNDSGG